MKKIIAFLTALIISVTVMASSFKANAVILEASALAELIEIVSTILVGSGTYTQSQLGSMSNSEILSTYTEAAPNIKTFPITKALNEKICNLMFELGKIQNSGICNMLEFIIDNQYSLDTYENPALNGAACSIIKYDKRSDGSLYVYSITYGNRGFFSNIGEKEFMVIIDSFKSVYYNDDGSISFTKDIEYNFSFYCSYTSDKYKFCGTWYNKDDGTVNTDLISSPADIPQVIGTVNVDGEELTVNGDGTVIKDGVTYVINEDGSVTIGDTTYYPDYDFSVYPSVTIANLVADIAKKTDVTDTTTDDVYDDTFENIGDKTAVGVETLDNLMLPKTIITVFPFSLPWDFVRGMKLFVAEPETPHFEVNIKVPAFLNVPEQKWNLVIDLKQFEPVAKISRWCSMIEFSLLLIFLTSKIVKGGV